jgi:hypothetical protein
VFTTEGQKKKNSVEDYEQTYLVTASSVRASPVLWRPITTHLFSAKASLANLTTAGTFADMHMCLKKRCKT